MKPGLVFLEKKTIDHQKQNDKGEGKASLLFLGAFNIGQEICEESVKKIFSVYRDTMCQRDYVVAPLSVNDSDENAENNIVDFLKYAKDSGIDLFWGDDAILESLSESNSELDRTVLPGKHAKGFCVTVNGIQIAFLQYNKTKMPNGKSISAAISKMKQAGADVVILLCNIMTEKTKATADRLSSSGADLLIFNDPRKIRKYYRVVSNEGTPLSVIASQGSSTVEKGDSTSVAILCSIERDEENRFGIQLEYTSMFYNAEEGILQLSESNVSDMIGKGIPSAARTESRTKKKEKKNKTAMLVAEKYGASYQEVRKHMIFVKERYQIDDEEYLKGDYWRYQTENALIRKIEQKKKREARLLHKLALNMKMSEEEVEKRAEEVQQKFGINLIRFYSDDLFGMTDEEIAEFEEERKNGFQEKIQLVCEETGWKKSQVMNHIKKCKTFWGIKKRYYFLWHCWELPDEVLATYLTIEQSNQLCNRYNKKRNVLANKARFNVEYEEYLGRKFWLTEGEDHSFESFEQFLEGLSELICKPLDQHSGVGVRKEKVLPENHRDLYDRLMAGRVMLVEECIQQHPIMSSVNPTSINTIRLFTLFADGEVHNLCSFVRFGKLGSVTDNFGAGGFLAAVDVKTGKLISNAIDKFGTVVERHPDSNVQFLDFQIPMWDKVLEIASAAIQANEDIHYVGWDVAICPDKVVLIEGNSLPNGGAYQTVFAAEHIGQKYLFDPYLNDISEITH